MRLKRAQKREKGEVKVPLWAFLCRGFQGGCDCGAGLHALFHSGCLNEPFCVSFLVQPLPCPSYCSPLRSCPKTELIFLSEVFLILPKHFSDHRLNFINVIRERGVILNLYLEAGEKLKNHKYLFLAGLQIVKCLNQSQCVCECMYPRSLYETCTFGFDGWVHSHTHSLWVMHEPAV